MYVGTAWARKNHSLDEGICGCHVANVTEQSMLCAYCYGYCTWIDIMATGNLLIVVHFA